MDNQPLQITEEDLAKLWQTNPLASEQMQKIMLARQNADLMKQLKETKACTCNDKELTFNPEKELESVTE